MNTNISKIHIINYPGNPSVIGYAAPEIKGNEIFVQTFDNGKKAALMSYPVKYEKDIHKFFTA